MTPSLTEPLSISDLRAAIEGEVLAPDDADYDAARATLYGGDLRPVAIVRAAGADDVAHVVRLAAAIGLELAIRSGGHSGAAHGTTDGGIQLDLKAMKGIDIDVAGRTVWAETGLTASELTTAVGEHGLVIGFGDTGTVGIGGITTGGGVGYLVRKYGLTIDNVIAADVVTADGELVRTDADHHPDLFWAIRGGGGNFGVVTRFQYRLQTLPSVIGGILILPATADTVADAVAAAEAAPEEVSAILNVMPCPPMPFVAKEHHGKLVVFAMLAFAGGEEAGERALAPFRALATPLADLVRPMSYAELFPPEDEGHPAMFAANRTMFMDRVDREVAERIVTELEEHGRTPGTLMSVSQLRVLGGAMARVPVEATAFAHRSSRIMVNLAALVATTAELPAHEAWVLSFAAALQQGDTGAYVNFVSDEGPERVHAAYPGGTWDRLVEVKNRYDPTNLFRRNHNIPPTAAPA
ncbi:MAG: FAD-binding oxidoreductase [Chloroflexi bacterium]|nr:FAD-binding oxidoreductase [Chloroflexota bacterium]